MDVGEIGDQLFFDSAENYSAQHRAPDRANASDYRHEQNGNAGLKSKYVSGIEECCAARVHAAGNSHQRSRQRMDFQLGVVRVHAQISGGIFILLDGTKSQAKSAAGDDGGNAHGQRHHNQRSVVMLKRSEWPVLNDAIAA